MPEICIKCAAHGKTCCQWAMIFVTPGDVRRIRAFTGNEDFHRPSPATTIPNSGIDRPWEDSFRTPRRRVLVRKDDGNCTFLTESGCALPLETRPLLCRLYPLDYNDVTIKGVDARLCPVTNPALIMAELAIDRDRAEEWRRLFYSEIDELLNGQE